ncbi:hypothetical protein BaRGS_00032264 [Batillaria attramentaria]|uniref:Uncharacterized protein n=1 Tax=Batillaria attramentaria TaxID=370345 RepID=A0ABD0JNY8_9CAEN
MSGSGSLVFACVFSCLLWQDVAPRPATRRAAGNPTSLNIPGAGGDTFLSLTLTAGRRGKQRRYPNCSLQTVYPVRDKLNTLLKREAKLIEMDLSLPDYPPNFLQHRLPDYFRPTHWVRTTGREGRRLLVLEDNYDFMSLFFLRSLKSEELLYVVREYLLNDFKIKGSPDEGGSLSRDGHVCHMKAVDKDGTAKFVYECCHLCPEGDVICEEVGYDVWIETLMTLLVVTKVLIILYSPSFLPKSLYLPKPHQGEYIYYRSSVEPRKTLRLRIMDRPDQSHKKVVHISRLKGMKNFREYLSRSRKRGNNGTITCRLQRGCRIFVKSRRLLGENEVPVGIFQAIYQNLFRCRIKHLESLHPCCHKYVCGNPKTGASEGCCRGCCLRPIKWYKLLRRLSRGVLLFICIVPWLIRVGVFYQFEDETVAEKKRFAEEHHLETEFKSLTLHLTPLHILFIVVYSIFAVDSLVFGVISKAMSEKFTYVSRDSFREMRKTSEIGMCSVITRLLVLPFEKHGLLGFLLFPFYFVLLLVVGIIPLMFYLFPFLNLTAKLILNVLMLLPKKLSKKKKNFKEYFSKVNPDNNELMLRRWEKPLQFLIIPMCLVSFWSVTLLLMEVVAFFVEVGVYTLMGIVVNAGSILQYMTVSVLVFVYARSELGSVYKKYLAYHKDIHNQLMKLGRDDIAEVAKQDEKDQEKTAFCLLGKLDLATAKNKPFRPEIRYVWK